MDESRRNDERKPVSEASLTGGNPVSERIGAWLAQYVRTFAFSGSVAVLQNGSQLYNGAFGCASIEHQVPNTSETRYRIWSVTKQFTAAAILLLEGRGLLRVEDRLRDHFPEWESLDSRITIHQLLNHTSGLRNYSSLPDSRHTFQRLHHSPEELVRLFTGWPLEFEPGSRFRYSNTGYHLLGLLVERLSGQRFAAFLEENIFRPLGMHGTGLDDGRHIISRLATGYHLDGYGLVPCGYVDMALMASSGGLYSTVGDLLRWSHALDTGRVLSQGSLARMQQPGLGQYGYGVAIDMASGRRLVRHGGGCEGFLSELHRYVDEGLTVAVLSNYGFTAVDRICRSVAAIARGERVGMVQRPLTYPLPENLLSAYLGQYGTADGTRVELRRPSAIQAAGRAPIGRTQLEIVLDGDCRLPVYPSGETEFHHAWIDESYEMGRDEAGRLTLWGLPRCQDG